MNIYSSEILMHLKETSNQRQLSEITGYSLGQINKTLKFLEQEQFVTDDYQLTKKAINLLETSHPKNAIILAAGYGMRMVPINTECPKGLLTINNEPLIERLIKQLHEKNIKNIYIVVGFMKESYEYLIDKYNVRLIYNKDYSHKNNLHSLKCALNLLDNSYIIPCDIYSEKNIFSEYELYTWYSVTEIIDDYSTVRINRQQELENISENKAGNTMIGISYITNKDCDTLKKNILSFSSNKKYDNNFWEEALFGLKNITVYSKLIKSSEIVEINSYEQLREFDSESKALNSEAISIITKVLNCNSNEIHNIETLKKGMTNRSFFFSVNNNKYIMRIPGEGTALLINRKEEAEVYETIKDYNLCDDLFYINPKTGYKITKYIENATVCDPYNIQDLSKCMKKLRYFHSLKLKVSHEFNLFDQINFYESLRNGYKSCFTDYEQTKKNVFSLKAYIDNLNPEKSLTHIDAVPDNFLFSTTNNIECIQLIDWEYAGMQDPHVDIAMFCIYSLYDEKKYIDQVIDLYFDGKCSSENRIKIYCYIAICGLLWSNWCEYKRQLGIDFGEYSLKQYRYAKEYCKIAKNEIDKLGFIK